MLSVVYSCLASCCIGLGTLWVIGIANIGLWATNKKYNLGFVIVNIIISAIVLFILCFCVYNIVINWFFLIIHRRVIPENSNPYPIIPYVTPPPIIIETPKIENLPAPYETVIVIHPDNEDYPACLGKQLDTV